MLRVMPAMAAGVTGEFWNFGDGRKSQRPPIGAASLLQSAVWGAYFSWVEMLVKFVFNCEPRVLTTAMIATEIPAAMRPYSMAVAPESFFKKATILRIYSPMS